LKKPVHASFGTAGLLGLSVLVMSLVFGIAFPYRGARLPEGFFTPIIAFEFIETEQEVLAMFSGPDGAIDPHKVDTMNAVNRLDFVYMLVYSMFLLTFAFACARLSGKKYLYAAVVMSLAVLLFDALENIQLLGITSKLESRDFAPQLARLHIFTWIKWGGIATILVLLAPYFLSGGVFSKALGWLAAATFLIGLGAFLHRSVLNEIFFLCIGLMFLSMTVYSFVRYRDIKKGRFVGAIPKQAASP